MSSAALSHWVKNCLLEAGIDSQVLKARSTRGAATSAALRAGISVPKIVSLADKPMRPLSKSFITVPFGTLVLAALFYLVPQLSKDLEALKINCFIIWLAPRAGKMKQILRRDWLPERVRWSYLARSGLPTVSRKKNFPESRIINPLLTKLVRSRWLDIGLVLVLRVYGPRLRLGP